MLTRWNPIREMFELRNRMDRLFENSLSSTFGEWQDQNVYMTLPIDMRETDDALIIQADLPGVKADELDLTVSGDKLTIAGEFKDREAYEQGDIRLQERRFGKFQRMIRLPSIADADHTEATFEDGVLSLTIPKVEEAKPKQIPLKV